MDGLLGVIVVSLGIMLWVMVAFWPALIASRKGYNFWLFFLLSLPFWWIMLFVALFIKDKSGPDGNPAVAA